MIIGTFNYDIKTLNSGDPLFTIFSDKILRLDKENMGKLFQDAGIELFSDEWRRDTFNLNNYFIILSEDKENIIGYIEYGFINQNTSVFIYSFQISTKYRKKFMIIGRLFYEIFIQIKEYDISNLVCYVFITNTYAIQIYEKLGFTVKSLDGGQYLLATAPFSELKIKIFNKIMLRYYN